MNLFKTEPAAPAIPCIGLNADDAAKAIGISKKMAAALHEPVQLPSELELRRLHIAAFMAGDIE